MDPVGAEHARCARHVVPAPGRLCVLGVSHGDLSPMASANGAIAHVIILLSGFFVTVVAVMAVRAIAWRPARRLGREPRVTFENIRIFGHYVVARSLVALPTGSRRRFQDHGRRYSSAGGGRLDRCNACAPVPFAPFGRRWRPRDRRRRGEALFRCWRRQRCVSARKRIGEQLVPGRRCSGVAGYILRPPIAAETRLVRADAGTRGREPQALDAHVDRTGRR